MGFHFPFRRDRDREQVACTVEIDNTFDQLGAHVELAGAMVIEPGDEVIVHGGPISVPFGETARFERTATVFRATALERWWTKIMSTFELSELYEVSFSNEVTPEFPARTPASTPQNLEPAR